MEAMFITVTFFGAKFLPWVLFSFDLCKASGTARKGNVGGMLNEGVVA